MTKELIVAAVLGTALTAGWFIPVGLRLLIPVTECIRVK